MTTPLFALQPSPPDPQAVRKLHDYLKAIRGASTPHALESAFRATFRLGYARRTQERIRDAVYSRGLSLCTELDLAGFVPRYDRRSTRLMVCGESILVGRGGNSAGVRWVWATADNWVKERLQCFCPDRVARDIQDWWKCYPHRALRSVLRYHRRQRRMDAGEQFPQLFASTEY